MSLCYTCSQFLAHHDDLMITADSANFGRHVYPATTTLYPSGANPKCLLVYPETVRLSPTIIMNDLTKHF